MLSYLAESKGASSVVELLGDVDSQRLVGLEARLCVCTRQTWQRRSSRVSGHVCKPATIDRAIRNVYQSPGAAAIVIFLGVWYLGGTIFLLTANLKPRPADDA